LWFYDGKLVHPVSMDDIVPFLWRMWAHVRKVNDVVFSSNFVYSVP